MTKKLHRPKAHDSQTPVQTLASITDGFVESMHIPALPGQIPKRLEDALRARIKAFLFHLKEAEKEGYVRALEVRLVRDAHRAVLTAYELGMREGKEYYAAFRKAVAALGYERTDVGFRKQDDPPYGEG